MKRLSNCIDDFMDMLSIDNRKIAQAAFNNQQYKMAVLNIWNSADASNLILERTNAFYIRRDYSKKIKKSTQSDDSAFNTMSGDVVCEIYVEDSIVLSELNAHREMLIFALRTNGLTFDEMKLIHSKGTMRMRHPFVNENADVSGK